MRQFLLPMYLVGMGSGGGTTLGEIMLATKEGGPLHGLVRMVLAIATNAEAGLVERLVGLGMEEGENLLVMPYKKEKSEEWGRDVLRRCRQYGANHLGLYGCIPTVPASCIAALIADGVRCTNQHPAWPREFGGVGMVGKRAVAAQLLFERMLPRGNNFTAAAVCQDLDPVVDAGRVLHFERCPILDTDDPESFQKRLLSIEHQVQIEALRRAALGELVPVEYPTVVRPGEETRCRWAKEAAFALYREGIPYRKSLAQIWAQQAAQ